MKLSFAFVCQRGPLEIEALLLAWSLRAHVRAPFELLVGVPQPASIWGAPSDATLEALAELGAQVRTIENRFDPGYPTANKISCLDLELGADVDKRVLLDTDTMLVSPFGGDRPELRPSFCAGPARHATFSAFLDAWAEVYGTFGLDVPQARVRATVSGEEMPLYFNSGFVAVDRDVPFAETWLDCCRRIDANPRIRRKRPWLDQIALPVAAVRLGLEIGVLPEAFNFPVRQKPIDESSPPFFCHYHRPKYLQRRPPLLHQARRALSEVEALRALVAGAEEWDRLHEAAR
jgi:hypothetical protein